MARMIPPDCNETNLSHAEKELFYKFKQSFDNNWTIFHSYDLTPMNCENKRIDAEIDFLLFNINYGILVIEVKGGNISVKDGQWFQNNKKLKLDPEKQARKNKYCVKNFLNEYLKGDPPLPFGHCVCFPNYYDDRDKLPATYRSITICGSELSHLDVAVKSIMKEYKGSNYRPIDRIMEKTIRRALMPEFEYGSSLIDKIGQEDRKIFSLTEKQCELLDFISECNKALIKGCAGSGKTVMAIKKAKQLARMDKSVLLLCYNNMLGSGLKNEVKDEKNIYASTYHNYCINVLNKAGYEINSSGKGDEFWTTDIPNMFLEYLTDNPIKYDAVIVDEGQDFKEEYWISISDLIVDDGHYYIFYDPDQNLYGSKLKFPELSQPFTLNTNCRNTKKIFDSMSPFASWEINVFFIFHFIFKPRSQHIIITE